LAAFPEGTNPFFRERTEHDCSCCKQFIRNIGNVVAIVNGKLESVWGIEDAPYPYNEIARMLDYDVTNTPINSLYRVSERKFGVEYNFEAVAGSAPIKWNHFHAVVPKKFLSNTPAKHRGEFNTSANVLKRGLDEFQMHAFETTLDLIQNGNLYRGEEFERAVREFEVMLARYRTLSGAAANIFVWQHAAKPIARFRNTAIGTLIDDLSEGMDLERAVASFEAKVAPTNYKRPKALITQSMVKDAMKTISKMGLEPALERRFARLSDVSVNNVLWVSNEAQAHMKDGIEGLLMSAATTHASKTKPVDIGINDFMDTVLPAAKSVEVFVASALQNRFMSVTTAVDPDAPKLFKWDNPFAWSYDGNITDSIKERVKTAGGNTDAILRMSLAWFNTDDLDIHVREPNGNRIYYGNKSGKLDVDMNAGGKMSRTPVENVSFDSPMDGEHIVYVNQYSRRNSTDEGFVLEIANGGNVNQYSYKEQVRGTIEALKVTVRGSMIVDIKVNPKLTGGGISQEKWGIHTEKFVKVDTLMFSPNHWDDQTIGNKHWFFILADCVNDQSTRGIYNEFLLSDLDKHRKVFEVLGNKTMCPPADEQLSGLGFSSTQSDSVLVRVSGEGLNTQYNILF
jgi:hypothetical protein